jgi:hypothetical protein
MKEIMYPASTPKEPSPAPALTARAAAAASLYGLSAKPLEEQRHYQSANALFAGAIVKAQRNNDRAKIRFIEQVRDQAAAASIELGLNDAGTKQFLSGIAKSVGSPKTRSELTPADHAYLIEKHGDAQPALSKLAAERAVEVLAGKNPKPELHKAMFNSDAPVNLDVVEPVFEAIADARASDSVSPPIPTPAITP